MAKPQAVLVLPDLTRHSIADPGILRRLSRGTVTAGTGRTELFDRVLAVLGEAPPAGGYAALRYFGGTGQEPAGFVCAADPVHLETRMRDLVLHDLAEDEVTDLELDRLFRTIDETLAGEDALRFVASGRHGYLFRGSPMPSSGLSASAASGSVADRFMPSGESARDYHRLQSELQMLLHDHAVNAEREDAGRRRINALWFWGGGCLPPPSVRKLPPLWSDDDLWRGFWRRSGAESAGWPADTDGIFSGSPQGMVAVLPPRAAHEAPALLECAMAKLDEGVIARLTVVAGNGVDVVISRADRLRIWRGVSPLFGDDHVA